MKRLLRFALILGTFFPLAAGASFAQGTKADYERAAALRNRFNDRLAKFGVRPRWLPDHQRLWYRNDLPDGRREFIIVDAEAATRKPAFDSAKLAEALSKAVGKPIDADRLPFDRLEFKDDGSVVFEFEGKGRRFDPSSDKLTEAEAPAAAPEPAAVPGRRNRPERHSASSPRGTDSPDGKWSAFVRDHNLHLRKTGSTDEFPLSFEGSETDSYESGVFWSPDSKKLVALRLQKGDTNSVHLIASSPKDQLQPKLVAYDYLKPGDKVPIFKPHLFDLETRKEILVSHDLFANPWSIEEIRWNPDSSRFTFLFNQRGHQVLRIVAIDASTGESKGLVDEQSKTFVDYADKTFIEYLDPTNELIWMSERDGWNHLYLIDLHTGAVKNQITKGDWLVRAVDRIDAEKRQVWFRALGIRPGQDPYYVHCCRINFDGTGLVVLTEGDGTHSIEFSPDRKYVLDEYSRVDMPTVTELRRAADGGLVCDLERRDPKPLVEAGWSAPERYVARGRDGKTDIFGVIYRPSTFDPWRKYPVIEAIYAGPQGAFVPKGFALQYAPQMLAELGFILVQIDGMGTNWRSKKFHDICWKNLGDAGFPDRIAWMQAAAKSYPYMDITKVGIYGGSAGGQNALGGLLFHPEFYKVGVADCGCHDNRMDKIWWNELWMGWPIGPHYAEQSNVTNAHKLQGKLMLTVGENDHNVDPASTMQVVNALIKADKDFELIVFPGADHGAGSSPYGRRRMFDFFTRHLLGVEPRTK